jgi:hypothetical protein
VVWCGMAWGGVGLLMARASIRSESRMVALVFGYNQLNFPFRDVSIKFRCTVLYCTGYTRTALKICH